MMNEYPKAKYAKLGAGFTSHVVFSREEESELGPKWVDSPAEFGVETCPAERLPEPEPEPEPEVVEKKKGR